jgi:hypothetical protein
MTLGAAAVVALIAAVLAAGLSGGSGSAINTADHVAAAHRTVQAKDAAADNAHKADTEQDQSQQGSGSGDSKHAAPQHSTAAKPSAPKHGAPKHRTAKHGAAKQGAAKHGAPKRGAAEHGAAKHGAASHHAARHQAKRHHRARVKRPYLIYDSVTPSAIASHRNVAAYANGNYAASASQVAGHRSVLWIDVTGYDHNASVLDVEPGDATPSLAASWAWHRLHAHPTALARIYTMRSLWPAVQAAVAHLPAKMRSHVRYWIADPTGTPHIVPGSDATQWYWGSSYDITSATPRF